MEDGAQAETEADTDKEAPSDGCRRHPIIRSPCRSRAGSQRQQLTPEEREAKRKADKAEWRANSNAKRKAALDAQKAEDKARFKSQLDAGALRFRQEFLERQLAVQQMHLRGPGGTAPEPRKSLDEHCRAESGQPRDSGNACAPQRPSRKRGCGKDTRRDGDGGGADVPFVSKKGSTSKVPRQESQEASQGRAGGTLREEDAATAPGDADYSDSWTEDVETDREPPSGTGLARRRGFSAGMQPGTGSSAWLLLRKAGETDAAYVIRCEEYKKKTDSRRDDWNTKRQPENEAHTAARRVDERLLAAVQYRDLYLIGQAPGHRCWACDGPVKVAEAIRHTTTAPWKTFCSTECSIAATTAPARRTPSETSHTIDIWPAADPAHAAGCLSSTTSGELVRMALVGNALVDVGGGLLEMNLVQPWKRRCKSCAVTSEGLVAELPPKLARGPSGRGDFGPRMGGVL